MMTDTARPSRYALSFTSGALLMREALIAAPIYYAYLKRELKELRLI